MRTKLPSSSARGAATRAKKQGAAAKTAPGLKAPEAATASARERLPAILEALRATYPTVTCALDHVDPFQLLVATILSAQCTDERVNQVTPRLFERYPTPAALAKAELSSIEEIIRSTGFFHNKARSIQGASARIVEGFGGRVPRTLEDLTTLPGVARKTANVVMGTAFGVPSGVVVDTHVRRLSGRLGLTTQTDPEKIERDLMDLLPEEEWIDFSHRLIWHGRKICKARAPQCERCLLAPACPSAGA
ncbi:MAG: endonuclease III [Polyangia bacterium]|jgi:endonuclease-3|nr:endonuclease III [Polyangia bacterium]